MRVIVIGSGGREHALAWRLARSPSVRQVQVWPGNGGTARAGWSLPASALSADAPVADQAVALADGVKGVVPVEEAAGRRIDQVVIGSCTSGGSKSFLLLTTTESSLIRSVSSCPWKVLRPWGQNHRRPPCKGSAICRSIL